MSLDEVMAQMGPQGIAACDRGNPATSNTTNAFKQYGATGGHCLGTHWTYQRRCIARRGWAGALRGRQLHRSQPQSGPLWR